MATYLRLQVSRKRVESVCGCVMQESLDTVEAVVKKHRKIKWLQKTWVLVLVLDIRGGSGVYRDATLKVSPSALHNIWFLYEPRRVICS